MLVRTHLIPELYINRIGLFQNFVKTNMKQWIYATDANCR